MALPRAFSGMSVVHCKRVKPHRVADVIKQTGCVIHYVISAFRSGNLTQCNPFIVQNDVFFSFYEIYFFIVIILI